MRDEEGTVVAAVNEAILEDGNWSYSIDNADYDLDDEIASSREDEATASIDNITFSVPVDYEGGDDPVIIL
ncbi:MAG: hypothetical protein ACYDGY_09710 [Acidimicrobiales bacterium]